MDQLLIIAALILLNGLFAMSEIAILSVRKSQLLNEVKKGNKAAKTALELTNDPDRFLSTIQIGITIIGILTGIFSGNVLAHQFGEWLVRTFGLTISVAEPLAQILIVVIVTYLTLIFGELVPKRIGLSRAEKTSLIMARPMLFLARCTAPFVWLLSKSTGLIAKLLHLDSPINTVTEAEIKTLVQEGTEQGEVQQIEQKIVNRVFQMGDLKVSSLMTHRSDIIFLENSMNATQIEELLTSHLFHVYPVVNDNLNSVTGVVTLKELIRKLHTPEFSLQKIQYMPQMLHENMSVFKALEHMQNQKINFALICDEFGVCQGLLTLKDILRGLVGNCDEYHAETEIQQLPEQQGWLVKGRCALHYFLTYFNIEELPQEESHCNTIGGIVLQQLGHIPQINETVRWQNFQIIILSMKGTRIENLVVKRCDTPECDESIPSTPA